MSTSMRTQMTEEAKARLKNRPKVRCTACNTPRSYTNPIEKCIKCKQWFCFDHIYGVIERDGVNNYCDGCVGGKAS